MCVHEGREHRTGPCWKCRADHAALVDGPTPMLPKHPIPVPLILVAAWIALSAIMVALCRWLG